MSLKKIIITVAILLFIVVLLSTLFFSQDGNDQSFASGRVLYSEKFDAEKSGELMFKGHLLFGNDGAWAGSLENGRYILENSSDNSAVRYYYFSPDTGHSLTNSRISVEVDGSFSKNDFDSGAGLIFDLDSGTRFYLAFVIMNQNEYGIIKRDENGFKIMMRGTHSAIVNGKPNRLSIISEKEKVAFLINEQEIGSLGHRSGEANGIGLLALGTGRFIFDNFIFASIESDHLISKDNRGEEKQAVTVRKSDSISLLPLSPPKGFTPVDTKAGNGQAWLYNSRGAASSREALMETLNRLRQSQMNNIILYSAVADINGLEIRTLFGADTPSGEVRGMIISAKDDTGFISACLFDSPASLGATLNLLIQGVSRHLPSLYSEKRSPQDIKWRQAMIPDGSGTMMLPSDWQVMGGSKGMVDAGGQDGSRVSLGIWTPVLAQAVDPYYTQFPGGASLISAPYTDPVTALQQVFPQMLPGTPQKILRFYSSSPTPWPNNGQAAYCHFDWQLGEGEQALKFTAFALVGIMPGMGQWTFYISIVSTPPQLFAGNLPMLLEIWKSWDVADYVHQERLSNAMNDMKEINNILNQSYNNRQNAQDRIAANWTEVIRDQTFFKDSALGDHYEVPLTAVQDWTRALNERAGYERYHHVPLRDIR